MKKRTSAWVLLLVAAGVLLSHLSWEEKDNGHLLLVDGVPLDVVGIAKTAGRSSTDNALPLLAWVKPIRGFHRH